MTSPTILHMDMDAFFASVEQLDNPALRGKCLVVGGLSNRGVVAAASYEARKFGIHSAMPIFQAKQKCADLVIVPPRRKRYSELSHRIMGILEIFSPIVEPVSIDEAYVDISGCARLFGEPLGIAEAVKTRIKDGTQLTCSVGVAPNKFLAKIASDFHKPDGLTLILPEQVDSFIQTLPIDKVPGVGAKALQKLSAMGIDTLGQVGLVHRQTLIQKFGKFGYRLYDLAHGKDDSPVTSLNVAKSVSSEITLENNTRDRLILSSHLLAQAQLVARQLRQHHLMARIITLKIKTSDFKRHSHSQTLANPIRSSDTIYQTALDLLDSCALSFSVRLIGIAAGGLQSKTTPVQQDIFEKSRHTRQRKWEQVDEAMDAVAQRFGHHFVIRGALVDLTERGVRKKTKK